MFVFVDETGNTGGNLFDSAQPDFLTGALVTKTDFDMRRSRAVRSLCRQRGISSIHGSVIGVGAVESVAGPLLRMLKDVDARFFISRVEKIYLLGTKVFDTFFDSGENAAVPWTAYNVKPLRLLLCFTRYDVPTLVFFRVWEAPTQTPYSRRAYFERRTPALCGPRGRGLRESKHESPYRLLVAISGLLFAAHHLQS